MSSTVGKRNCQMYDRAPFPPFATELSMLKLRSLPARSLSDATSVSVSGPVKDEVSKRRVTDALTAKEVYDLAPDPSLVPEPLTIRKQLRNVAAPDVLQSAQDTTIQAEPLRGGRIESRKLANHFRDRPRAHRHAILDMITRLIATGLNASEIANYMGLDLQELTQHIASFAVAVRDTPGVLDEEIYSFYSSLPTSSDQENSRADTEPGTGETSEGVAVVNGEDEGWDRECEEEETLIACKPDVAEEGAWIDIEKATTRQARDREKSQLDEGQGAVYYDAVDRQEYDEPARKYADQLDNHEITTCFRQVANLQQRRRRPALAPIFVPPVQANPGTTHTVPPSRPPHRSRLVTIVSKVPMPLVMILSVIIGRVLGVLCCELQAILTQYGPWVFDLVARWLRPATVVFVVIKEVFVRV